MADARVRVLVASLLASAWVFACVGDDPSVGGNGGGGDASTVGPEGGGPEDAGPSAPPASAPASLRFHNQDVRDGFVEGRVKLAKAANESDIAEYVLYWGTSATAKAPGEPLAVYPRGTSEHVFTFPAETRAPLGATHVLAFSRNARGESQGAVAAVLANKPQYIDPTASLKIDAGSSFDAENPRALVDVQRQKLLIVSTIEGMGSGDFYMGTFACDLDATGCVFNFACTTDSCGMSPRAAIDATSGKLVLAARDAVEENRLVAYSCGRDGTACMKSLAPGAGQPAGSGEEPWPFFDAATKELVVFTSTNESGGRNGHLLATRCDASLKSCASPVDVTGSLATRTALEPAAVQLPNGKFAIATASITAGASGPHLALYLTDGTAANTTRGLPTTTPGTGRTPAIALDPKNERIVIVTQDETKGSRLLLTRCRYDGAGCSSVEIGASSPAESGHAPSVVVDTENEKILVVSHDQSNAGKPLLTRCNLDGSACRTIDFSAGQGNDSGEQPSLAIDPINGYLIAVTRAGGRPAVIRWGI